MEGLGFSSQEPEEDALHSKISLFLSLSLYTYICTQVNTYMIYLEDEKKNNIFRRHFSRSRKGFLEINSKKKEKKDRTLKLGPKLGKFYKGRVNSD